MPLLPGERVARCSKCGSIGLQSPVRARSHFYRRGDGKWYACCRSCEKRRASAHQARTRCYLTYLERRREREAALSPEEQEALRARQAGYRRRYNERHPERAREAQVRYRERHPERARASDKRRQADRRANRELERRMREQEAAGTVAPPAPPQANRWGRDFPIGPYREWVDTLVRVAAREPAGEMTPEQSVAAALGVSKRTLYRWRYEMETISEGTLDAVLTRYDGVLWMAPDAMYPELAG